MSAQMTDSGAEVVNEVRLVGRISQQPEERVLPSGDTLWTLRIVVDRPVASRGALQGALQGALRGAQRGTRRQVDALECVAWSGRVKRSVAGWRVGDVVEVSGALRRRFFRASGAAASRVEVEVASGRVIRRAASE